AGPLPFCVASCHTVDARPPPRPLRTLGTPGDGAPPARRVTPRPALTVVVMGYRNQETIGEALTSLVEQDSPEPFEVVVVTSGGGRSAAVARETAPGIQVVDSPTRLMPGGARNAGVSI